MVACNAYFTPDTANTDNKTVLSCLCRRCEIGLTEQITYERSDVYILVTSCQLAGDHSE